MPATPLEQPHEQYHTPFSVDDDGNIRKFNSANEAHEDLWSRARSASDRVREAIRDRDTTQRLARGARDHYRTVREEFPGRTAPLLRQWAIALSTIALDGVACSFAAQALGNGQAQTLLWTVLFLATLVAGTISLDHYSDHDGRTWSILMIALSLFVAGLGLLRYLFLLTVGIAGPVAALVGSLLFTATTAGFLFIGYRSLRSAERLPVWQARRRVSQAERKVAAASRRVSWLLRERDRLVGAYLNRIRIHLLQTCPVAQLPQLEAMVREHLTGGEL